MSTGTERIRRLITHPCRSASPSVRFSVCSMRLQTGPNVNRTPGTEAKRVRIRRNPDYTGWNSVNRCIVPRRVIYSKAGVSRRGFDARLLQIDRKACVITLSAAVSAPTEFFWSGILICAAVYGILRYKITAGKRVNPYAWQNTETAGNTYAGVRAAYSRRLIPRIGRRRGNRNDPGGFGKRHPVGRPYRGLQRQADHSAKRMGLECCGKRRGRCYRQNRRRRHTRQKSCRSGGRVYPFGHRRDYDGHIRNGKNRRQRVF